MAGTKKLALGDFVTLPSVPVETTIKKDTILAVVVGVLLTFSLVLLLTKIAK
tara:strand:- start:52 stop:207 length:156 start_codon:yes stop_codon:yes gene_type:complete